MKHRVLIVDDDEEIGHYISTELSHRYKFTVCNNGKEGLKELLANNTYDLVISDVMMPEMDGFTLLRLIKTNLNLSHIPVIMLTSKADVGNRLEGLERGADAFLAKPFDMEELHLTIENLIQTRQRLKGKFTGAQQQTSKLEVPEVKGNDEQLMERIMKALNRNLSDSDFNVEMLTQEVGISRAQLHRKMKEMTGLSTSEFIRNIRLEQAARLLKEQKINVTQVAYTVGFSNLAHFSTIFRKHFGIAPSEYAMRIEEEEEGNPVTPPTPDDTEDAE
jgi:YesN/AraC family two-component response regulator